MNTNNTIVADMANPACRRIGIDVREWKSGTSTGIARVLTSFLSNAFIGAGDDEQQAQLQQIRQELAEIRQMLQELSRSRQEQA